LWTLIIWYKGTAAVQLVQVLHTILYLGGLSASSTAFIYILSRQTLELYGVIALACTNIFHKAAEHTRDLNVIRSPTPPTTMSTYPSEITLAIVFGIFSSITAIITIIFAAQGRLSYLLRAGCCFLRQDMESQAPNDTGAVDLFINHSNIDVNINDIHHTEGPPTDALPLPRVAPVPTNASATRQNVI
jgi:hypothetical protein